VTAVNALSPTVVLAKSQADEDQSPQALRRKILAQLETDKLWSFCWNDRPAKDMLDVVVENTAGHFMKITCLEPVRCVN